MIAFQESEELDNTLRAWYNFLRDYAMVDGMLAYSLAMMPDAEHGSWGHLDNVFEEPCENNKYRVLMEYNQNHNGSVLHQNCASPKVAQFSEIANFQVYPNPFSNSLTLQTEKEHGIMRIVDMTGRTLLQQSIDGLNTTIDTKTLKPGYYLIEVENGGKTQTQKIIKY